MLNGCNRFNICAFLDNHQYRLPGQHYECVAAYGAVHMIKAVEGDALPALQAFVDQQDDWCFGHLSYDLKNEIYGLQTLQPNHIGFPDLCFFVPQYVVVLREQEVSIGSLENDHEAFWNALQQAETTTLAPQPAIRLMERVSRAHYLETIKQIRQHIRRGDCYELNYCMEFFAESVRVDPLHLYRSLTTVSPNPFSAYYKIESSSLVCASPERFLSKEGDRLFSQPIKGTLHRHHENALEDERLKQQLFSSSKERSENVMVVDLVRNDLSRVCREGTVRVEELFGIYSFPQVHQMISGISGTLKPGTSFTEIIRALFPMGSMTGAPKQRVLELIDRYEQSRRGIFSGAVGYLKPNGDFDFNVVIRSMMYNAQSGYLSYLVGSGITFYSDAAAEYEECVLKAEAMRAVLSS